MGDSRHVWRSGRSISRAVPADSTTKVVCSKCKKEVQPNPDGSLPRHKDFKPGTTKYSWCKG